MIIANTNTRAQNEAYSGISDQILLLLKNASNPVYLFLFKSRTYLTFA